MTDSLVTQLADVDETEADLSAQVQLLRSRVEAEFKKPAVVMVTSALQGDGKSLTAHSLAKCFSDSGQRAGLVTLTDRDAERVVGGGRMAAFIEGMRSNYDFTIVEAGTFFHSKAAIAVARLVDGILLTVRMGRPETDEDALLIETLKNSGAHVVGVVAIDEKTIAEFERQRTGLLASVDAPLRRGVESSARSYLLSAESLAQ
jgi:Mrp family chromosome partitioning ATPase